MILAGIGVGVVLFVVAVLVWRRQRKNAALLAAHTITAEELQRELAGDHPPKVYDVRQPLDLLVYSEVIPGSVRIPPHDIKENPKLIRSEDLTVVYCTCPGEKTSREIIVKALALDFKKVRILSGGLAGWKLKGFPVERYDAVFHLDTPV